MIKKFSFLIISEPPGPPSFVRVRDIGKSDVTIEWGPPPKDGGSKVKNYHIFKGVGKPIKWTKEIKAKAFETHFTVSSLKEGTDYYFAVAAENDIGTGPQTETDAAVSPKKPIGKLILVKFFRKKIIIFFKT